MQTKSNNSSERQRAECKPYGQAFLQTPRAHGYRTAEADAVSENKSRANNLMRGKRLPSGARRSRGRGRPSSRRPSTHVGEIGQRRETRSHSPRRKVSLPISTTSPWGGLARRMTDNTHRHRPGAHRFAFTITAHILQNWH